MFSSLIQHLKWNWFYHNSQEFWEEEEREQCNLSNIIVQINNSIMYAKRVLQYMQRYYSASARELARLVGICQAPVIQHFSETISGSTTIRCFEQESRFNDIHMKLIDRYSQPRLYSASAIEWLAFRLDILSITTFAFCLVSLISFPNSITAPGKYFGLHTFTSHIYITLYNIRHKTSFLSYFNFVFVKALRD